MPPSETGRADWTRPRSPRMRRWVGPPATPSAGPARGRGRPGRTTGSSAARSTAARTAPHPPGLAAASAAETAPLLPGHPGKRRRPNGAGRSRSTPVRTQQRPGPPRHRAPALPTSGGVPGWPEGTGTPRRSSGWPSIWRTAPARHRRPPPPTNPMLGFRSREGRVADRGRHRVRRHPRGRRAAPRCRWSARTPVTGSAPPPPRTPPADRRAGR